MRNCDGVSGNGGLVMMCSRVMKRYGRLRWSPPSPFPSPRYRYRCGAHRESVTLSRRMEILHISRRRFILKIGRHTALVLVHR